MTLWQKYEIPPDLATPPMAMDYRHVEMLHRAIIEAQPRIAVEIGSHLGHSLVAFLEAMDDLPDMTLYVAETHWTPELLALVNRSPHTSRICMIEGPVWRHRIAADFVFIDGDHGQPALADLAWSIYSGAKVIAMHDTRSFDRLPECWGARTIAEWLSEDPTRTWFEDNEDRPDEWTWRGFGVSVRI